MTMTSIPPHRLWIGHVGDVRDAKRLFDEGVQAVVELAVEEPPCSPPREMIHLRFPLEDTGGNRAGLLFLAVSSLATLLKMALPTLACCGSGRSRSPAVAAAALALVHGSSPVEMLEAIGRHHPCDVSPALWSELIRSLSLNSAGVFQGVRP
jgi:hypothetical protein